MKCESLAFTSRIVLGRLSRSLDPCPGRPRVFCILLCSIGETQAHSVHGSKQTNYPSLECTHLLHLEAVGYRFQSKRECAVGLAREKNGLALSLECLTSILSPLIIRRSAFAAPPHGEARLIIERTYFALNSDVC